MARIRGRISEEVHVSVTTSVFLGATVTVEWMGRRASQSISAMITEQSLEDAKTAALDIIMEQYGLPKPNQETISDLRYHTNNNWQPHSGPRA